MTVRELMKSKTKPYLDDLVQSIEIDPMATASYVYAYRDMWDEEAQAKSEERGVK